MPRFKDQAVCIRHFDWSETSQVVALLTREHGNIRGLAKGSRRSSPSAVARFCGGIELLTRGEIVATSKPSAELAALTEWDLQQPYFHLRRDLAAQRLAMYGVDLANAMIADHDPHPAAFEALCELLDNLRDSDAREAALLEYQWALLDDCGYRLTLDRDAVTGEPLADQATYLFDAQAGGLMVASGRGTTHRGAGPWRVRRETVEVLRAVDAGEIGAKPQAALGRANQLLCVYVRAILDRQLPTMTFVLDQGSTR